jgi:diguanylate cyclase (GGDEF)-like protein
VFRLTEQNSPHVQRGDRLVGISDPEAGNDDLKRRLAEQQRRGTPVSLMLLRVDRISELVDRHGAKGAELALRAAAQIIRVTKRDMDHAARLDIDLFSVLLPDCKLQEAKSASERIRAAIDSCKIPVDGEQLRLTVSIGVTETQSGDDTETVFARANHALESVRKTGGNRVHAAPELVEAKTRSTASHVAS